MNRLKELREASNLTLRELSNRTNISFTTISKMENEQMNISEDYIRILCSYFNVTSDYLLGLSNQKHNNKTTNFQFAFSDYDKLTDDQKEIIKNLAASLIAQNEKK